MISHDVTQEELAKLIIQKHENFMSEHRKEYDILGRIAVLREKQDQLGYWLDDTKGDSEKHEKYLQAKKAADDEITNLSEELKSLYSSSPKHGQEDAKARYGWLKNQIGLHEKAVAHWTAKISEIETLKRQASEEKTEAPKKKAVKKSAKKPAKKDSSKKAKSQKKTSKTKKA